MAPSLPKSPVATSSSKRLQAQQLSSTPSIELSSAQSLRYGNVAVVEPDVGCWAAGEVGMLSRCAECLSRCRWATLLPMAMPWPLPAPWPPVDFAVAAASPIALLDHRAQQVGGGVREAGC